jgi:hypothetical protein
MRNLKDALLDQYGDEGAETFDRYYAQIEYTVLWCIRLLSVEHSVIAVIPEGVEDVVILKASTVELHQVKTRDESQGPWSTAEVLPILCKLYHHRNAFPSHTYEFHFVSDGRADTKTQLKKGTYGSLYRLKQLLEIRHGGLLLTSAEQIEFDALQETILPRIRSLMLSEYAETLTNQDAQSLLLATWIDTDSATLRAPDWHSALAEAFEDGPYAALPYTTTQIREIHGRLILCIIGKIREKTIGERRVEIDHVLQCRTAASQITKINLDNVPGSSVLEKKAHLGGFDFTELPAFNRQRLLAIASCRELQPLGFVQDLRRLTVSLIDQHIICRDEVCRSEGSLEKVGPQILRRFRTKIPSTLAKIPSLQGHVDEQFCLGIAWEETNNCTLWWHSLDAPIELQI